MHSINRASSIPFRASSSVINQNRPVSDCHGAPVSGHFAPKTIAPQSKLRAHSTPILAKASRKKSRKNSPQFLTKRLMASREVLQGLAVPALAPGQMPFATS